MSRLRRPHLKQTEHRSVERHQTAVASFWRLVDLACVESELNRFERNNFEFKLGWELLEPADCEAEEPQQGIV